MNRKLFWSMRIQTQSQGHANQSPQSALLPRKKRRGETGSKIIIIWMFILEVYWGDDKLPEEVCSHNLKGKIQTNNIMIVRSAISETNPNLLSSLVKSSSPQVTRKSKKRIKSQSEDAEITKARPQFMMSMRMVLKQQSITQLLL